MRLDRAGCLWREGRGGGVLRAKVCAVPCWFVRRRFAAESMSDHIALLNAFNDWERLPAHARKDWCWRNCLSSNTLEMMADMRRQFLTLLEAIGFVDRSLGGGPGGGGGGQREPHGAYSDKMMLVRAVITAGTFSIHLVHVSRTSILVTHLAQPLLCTHLISKVLLKCPNHDAVHGPQTKSQVCTRTLSRAMLASGRPSGTRWMTEK